MSDFELYELAASPALAKAARRARPSPSCIAPEAMEAGCENASPLAVPPKAPGAGKATSPPLHDFGGLSVSPVARTPLHDFPLPPSFATPTASRQPLKELAPAQAASPQRQLAVRLLVSERAVDGRA